MGRGTWLRVIGAVAAGRALFVSFPPRPLWWLAPLGFAVLGLALSGRRARAGAGYGLLAGLGFFAPLLSWTGEYVGPLPWLVLAVLQAGFVACAGAGIAVVSRLPGWPLWAAGVWVAGEAARSRVPFGGFPWGRVAFGQADGVFAPLAALGGPALIGFAVALAGFGLTALLQSLTEARRELGQLAKCVRTDLDCADVCLATGRVLSRHTGYDANITRAVLQTCQTVCRSCADECEQHSDDACRICAAEARRCQRACEALLAGL